VLLYADRCIMCSRCVRFTREVSGTAEIGVFGRGAHEQIDIFPGQALDNPLSGNVIDICPVGALLDKDFLMSMRVWNLTAAPSIDGITCSGDNISIEHHDGRIYRVKPRTNLEVNQWWTSDEIRFGWKFVHDPARLRSCQTRVGGAGEPCDWNAAYSEIADQLRRTVETHGPGSLALLVSPMLSCEEAHLLGRLAAGLDDQAVVGVGPVPVKGQDQTFPGGYTIYAEKCPNARGVRGALEPLGPLDFDTFEGRAADAKAVVLTGNYPSDWVTNELASLVEDRFSVLIDTLPNRISDRVDVLLPGATWAEKAGTFENVAGRRQSFEPAIAVIELAKAEGQIALDLMAACGLAERAVFDAEAVRQQMGGAFVSDVHHPQRSGRAKPDMHYLPL
jgi:NADH-quinone oxidoreductase subunit G